MTHMPLLLGLWLSAIVFTGCETGEKQAHPEPSPLVLAQSQALPDDPGHGRAPALARNKNQRIAERATAPDQRIAERATVPDRGESLRIATWNLKWLDEDVGGGAEKRVLADYQKLAHYAARLRADVVAIQEVESEAAVYRVFSESDYLVVLSNHGAPQRTGFVVRREIEVTRHPDLLALNVGHLRTGTDITIAIGSGRLRLLSVHLKSGCYSGPLSRSKACRKLARQIPPLESWIDARESAQDSFVVLGDFNRRFFESPLDEVWSDLDDGAPPGLALWSPTQEKTAECQAKRPSFIDHLLFNRSARAYLMESSFVEHLYEAADSHFALSDHCPLSVDLNRGASPATSPPATSPPATSPPATSPSATSPSATSPSATSPSATSPSATSPPATSRGRQLNRFDSTL